MMEKWHSGEGRFTNLTPLFMHHLVHLARSQFKVNNSAKQNMKLASGRRTEKKDTQFSCGQKRTSKH